MKIINFLIFLYFSNIGYSQDYIIEFQAKVKNLKQYNISKIEKFRSYELEGTFTDNYGNYGKQNSIIISDIKDSKLLKLDATSEITYSNNEKIYMRGIREKSDVDAGIAYNVIIGATSKLKGLIGTKCTTSVRYFDDAIFGLNKCDLADNITKEMMSLKD